MRMLGEINTLGTEIYNLKKITLNLWNKVRKYILKRKCDYMRKFSYE